MGRPSSSYKKLLGTLLPRGKTWSRDAGAMPDLLDGISQELSRVDGQIDSLVSERDSRYTSALLPEQEADLGIETDAAMEDVFIAENKSMGTRTCDSIRVGAFVYLTDYTNNNLLQIDAKTMSILKTISVGAKPYYISYLFGYLWVSNNTGGTISKVDPDTFLVVATIAVGTHPRKPIEGGGYIWVPNTGSSNVTRINPITDVTLTVVLLSGIGPAELIYYSGYVWTRPYISPAELDKIDVSTGISVASYNFGLAAKDIIFYNGYLHLYLYTGPDNKIVKIKPSDGSVISQADVLLNGNAMVDYRLWLVDNYLWLLNEQQVVVEKVDLLSMIKVAGIVVGVAGDNPRAIIYALGYMWVINNNIKEIIQIDTEQNKIIGRFDVNNDCRLLNYDENNVLIPGQDYFYRIARETQAASLEERRIAVRAALLAMGGQDPQYFIDLAQAMGYVITITEYRPAWCGVVVAGESCGDQEVIFVWRAGLLYDKNYEDPTGADLEIILRRLKPAHTELIFCIVGPGFTRGFSSGFNAMPALTPEELTVGGFRWKGFTKGFNLKYGGGFKYGSFTRGFNNLK